MSRTCRCVNMSILIQIYQEMVTNSLPMYTHILPIKSVTFPRSQYYIFTLRVSKYFLKFTDIFHPYLHYNKSMQYPVKINIYIHTSAIPAKLLSLAIHFPGGFLFLQIFPL